MSGMDWLSLGSGLTTGAAEAIPQAIQFSAARKREAKRATASAGLPGFARSRFGNPERPPTEADLIELGGQLTDSGFDPTVSSALLRELGGAGLYRQKVESPPVPRVFAPPRPPVAPRPRAPVVDDPTAAIKAYQSELDPRGRDPEGSYLTAIDRVAAAGAHDRETGEMLYPNLVRIRSEVHSRNPADAAAYIDELLANPTKRGQLEAQPDGPTTVAYLQKLQKRRARTWRHPLTPQQQLP